MIIYMTDSTFEQTAKDLSDKDLEQQFHNMQTILKILAVDDTNNILYNDPAVEAWRGYGDCLFEFMLTIKDECDYRRIYLDSEWDNALKIFYAFPNGGIVEPDWLDNELIHMSHRQRLFELDPVAYPTFAWDAIEPPVLCHTDCEVMWPTHMTEESQGYV
jgi:hypothetical protein